MTANHSHVPDKRIPDKRIPDAQNRYYRQTASLAGEMTDHDKST